MALLQNAVFVLGIVALDYALVWVLMPLLDGLLSVLSLPEAVSFAIPVALGFVTALCASYLLSRFKRPPFSRVGMGAAAGILLAVIQRSGEAYPYLLMSIASGAGPWEVFLSLYFSAAMLTMLIYIGLPAALGVYAGLTVGQRRASPDRTTV